LSKPISQNKTSSDRSCDEDEALIQAFQNGKDAAFEKLVLKHKDRVFNLCYWFLGDYQEANDCAQDTFIKIYRNLKKFRFESTFSTWVYRITVNTCKNKVKSFHFKFSKKAVRLNHLDRPNHPNPSGEIADESRSPVIEHEKKERRLLFKKAINSLPADKKTVIVLRDIQGLSYEQIATITGLNLGTVKSKLARARQDLKQKCMGES
jgi:RNA polymerase sigma-70 factor (ECF subfamily)